MNQLIVLLCFIFARVASNPTDTCTGIDTAIKAATDSSDTLPCRCLPEEMGAMRPARNFRDEGDGIWIGCTRQSMPSVFRALNALNETLVSHLWIWDSLINIMPSDMFGKVRPKILTIENSGVYVFREGAFSNMGRRLKALHLKNNILKSIENDTFADLLHLETLDLTGNKLTEVTVGHFDQLTFLETLMLSDNQISHIEDGAFKHLTNLRTLNLANNKLTNITKNTFLGLVNLEVLSIQGNNLGNIDWGAFSHMKRLRTLDLGRNNLTKVELRGLESLQRLYVNNNSIMSLKRVSLRDLPSLSVLSVDRNQISRITDNDLSSLSQSSRLASLSFAENNISVIEGQAFEHVHQLTVLSLQNNMLASLTSEPKIPYLRPLKKLRVLSLAYNKITSIEDGELSMLENLKELILDHNRIRQIAPNALKGFSLTKLFINSNSLYYLHDGTFDSFDVNKLEAVDLSDNSWECVCSTEWIGPWLNGIGDRNTPSGSLGCLLNQCEPNEPVEEDTQQVSGIITIIGGILTVVAAILFIIIIYLYFHDNCYNPTSLKRMPSDTVCLISPTENLSYPNPFAAAFDKRVYNINEPIITSPTVKSSGANADPSSKKEQKRVRFG